MDPSTEEDHLNPSLSRRRLIGGVVSAGAALSLGGVFAKGSPAMPEVVRPKRGGRLRVGLSGGGSAETLNPYVGESRGFIDAARATNLFDRLIDIDGPFPRRVVPALAASLEPNRDASVWQIKLRRGVTFHDGKPFTADDVLYSLKYVADPKNALNIAGSVSNFDLNRTRKVSPTEIRLVLKQPDALLYSVSSVLHKVAMIQNGTTDFAHPVGTGPFKYESFVSGQSSLFSKNDDYWWPGKPYVDELQILSIPDSSARLNALMSGQVDAIEAVDFAQAKANAGNKKIQLLRARGAANAPIYMRLDRKPFTNKDVRTAMKLAIDREQVLKSAYFGYGVVGNDLFGIAWPSYNRKLPQRKYDPERAKFLLKKAGQSDLTVTLITSPFSAGFQETATVFAESAKAAGIKVNLKTVAPGDYFNTNLYYTKAPLYQDFWGGGAYEFLVPFTLLRKLGQFNETRWFRTAWERNFQKAVGTLNTERRNRLLQANQVDLWEEGGYIFPAFGDQIDGARPNVRGYQGSPRRAFGANYDFKSYWFA
jgi:peptide/nickel transport system substrate-binding protein